MEEWPAAGCFLSESLTPTTPPVIESWSSSSSNDDNSHIANASASTSSKKPKKRKIHCRLKTKLNFDECVLTQHKNQQWVTPKVTKILRQCLGEEERENVLDLKEQLRHECLVGRTEVVEKSHTESSSSSVGFVGTSPGQSSVQDLLKRRLSHAASKPGSFGVSAELLSTNLCLELVTPAKISLNRTNVVMSSSQESDFDDAQHFEKSPEILGSKMDGGNPSESCTTQSSPIIKLSKISRLKRKRKKITLPPTLSSSQEENIQLSPVIICTGTKRIQKLDKSNRDVSLAAALTEISPRVKNNETGKPFGTKASDSPTKSDFDSIIEDTQLSPIIKSIRRRSTKIPKSKDVVSLFVASSVAGSPILTSSSSIELNYKDVKSGEITPLVNRLKKPLNQNALKMYHSSPCAPTSRKNSSIFNHADELSKSSSPKSPVIKLLSSKKNRKNNLKKVQKNLVDSFRVSETSSESDAFSSTVEKKSLEQVAQGTSQSDFIEGTQLCPAIFTKRKSARKEINTGLKTSVLKDHSMINPSNPISSTERFSVTSGLPTEREVNAEKEISFVPPFKDFLVPLPLSSVDTQNPSDYNISVDLDTQNLTLPSRRSSYCQPVKNASHLFSTDSSPMNISFSTQDSMDLIVNSLLAKKGTVPDCLDAEPITIDSFSSQDTSSEARVAHPGKITTVSDLLSPKSSGYQIATCSSQSTDLTSPVRNKEPCINMDSAKKKKRLRKGGYAARLQHLLNRQKSASRIFQHEMLNNAEKLLGKGTRLRVDLMWHEFDKVLLQCTFSAQESTEETALLIMDANQCKKIAKNCIVTVYPPWHILTIPTNSAKVITDVFNFQVVSPGDELQRSSPPLTAVVQEFMCKCSEPLLNSAKCAFKLPRNGLEIFEVLFPNVLSINVLSRQIIHTTACDGTISELLALPSSVSDKHIDLCIQRVFQFHDLDKQEICWSLLGQDSRGELSEVMLPSSHGATTDYDAIVAGDVYRVSVVNVMKRIHRNKSPGLWAVIDCKNVSAELPSTSELIALTDNECNLKQLYIYLITATRDLENVKKLDSVFNWARHSWMKPTISNLFSVINTQSSDSYSVFSFRVKILLVTENIMYITDLSLSHTAQSYCTVGLRPSFYVPAGLASKKCCVAFLQDVQLLKGQLFMDRYSRVETATDQWPEEVVRALLTEKIIFGGLVATSAAKDLVSVSGKIIGVDEETAFEWLACIECSGNVLRIMPDGSNLCNVCNKTVLSRPMMSLEILVLSGDIVAKIKLQQSTIILLLPPSQNDGEGFEIARVLGKQIGPVDCLVLQSVTDKEFSFVLEELPSI